CHPGAVTVATPSWNSAPELAANRLASSECQCRPNQPSALKREGEHLARRLIGVVFGLAIRLVRVDAEFVLPPAITGPHREPIGGSQIIFPTSRFRLCCVRYSVVRRRPGPSVAQVSPQPFGPWITTSAL